MAGDKDRSDQSGRFERSPTNRAESLADGVYAIAMTILVLNLDVPRVPHEVGALTGALLNLWPDFAHYVLSFLLLGIFWIIHHSQFQAMERTDRKALWINLFTLMFVVLIPFTTSITSEYTSIWPGPVLFDANILIVGVLKLINWRYVCDHDLVYSYVTPEERRIGKVKNMISPLVACLAIGVAFIQSEWSTTTFLLIPLFMRRFTGK